MQMPVTPRAPFRTKPKAKHPRRSLRSHPLLVLLILGALVRLGLWAWFVTLPLHIWDEQDYNQLAYNLAQYGEFSFYPGHPTSLRPPLYPAILAGLYRLFGPECFGVVRLFQAGLGLLTVAVLYRIGRILLSPRAALLLAGLYCFYPSMLVYNNLLLTEVLFTFCLVCVSYFWIAFLRTGNRWLLVGAGCALGLAALTRSVLWLFPPILITFLCFDWQASIGRRVVACLVVLSAFAATIAPWSIRNTRLEKTFVAIDSMGGRNFMMGNYRFTPLYRSWDAISLTGEESWSHEVCATYAPEERSSQGRIDKLALRLGLHFVCDHPGLTFHRSVIKCSDFWGLERELLHAGQLGYFGVIPTAILLATFVIIVISYVGCLFLAVYGVVVTPPPDLRLYLPALLLIGYICAMHTLVFGHSRYHLPLMPLVLIFSAHALSCLGSIVKAPRDRKFWLATSLCCLLIGGWVWGLAAGDWGRFVAVLQQTS